jgi:hypothetical protein
MDFIVFNRSVKPNVHWVNRCVSIKPPDRPLFVVAPIGDKMVRRGECSDVPKADSCGAANRIFLMRLAYKRRLLNAQSTARNGSN